MQEKDFIRLFSTIGISHPSDATKGVRIERKKKLYRKLFNCKLRGFSYFKGPSISDYLEIDSSLRLHIEQQSEESEAVAVYYYQFKIGYIESEHSSTLKDMIENGLRLSALLKTAQPNKGTEKIELEIIERL